MRQLSHKVIMTSKLCPKCKVIHTKPWDKNCKAVVARDDDASVESRDAESVDSNDTAVSKDMNESQTENFAYLINSVKELTSRFTAYDTKIEA